MKDSRHFEYRGIEQVRIAASADRGASIDYLSTLLSALRADDPARLREVQGVLILGTEVGHVAAAKGLAGMLESLVQKLLQRGSLTQEIARLLDWAGVACPEAVLADAGVSGPIAQEFSRLALKTVIPVAISDFHHAARAKWQAIRSDTDQDDARCPGSKRLPSFQVLADWVSRVDTPRSWHLLMRWLEDGCPWVRDQAAWALRHWWSPRLCEALCDALVIGVNDPAAHEHSFFLLWRLGKLADPGALPVLESLVGTGYDQERELPGGPPPHVPKRNMLREAIRACGGAVQ